MYIDTTYGEKVAFYYRDSNCKLVAANISLDI